WDIIQLDPALEIDTGPGVRVATVLALEPGGKAGGRPNEQAERCCQCRTQPPIRNHLVGHIRYSNFFAVSSYDCPHFLQSGQDTVVMPVGFGKLSQGKDRGREQKRNLKPETLGKLQIQNSKLLAQPG